MTNIGYISPAHASRTACRRCPAVGARRAQCVHAGIPHPLWANRDPGLRIALGDHSLTLAELREEPDEPYRFSARERTFLLFLLQHTLACTCALIQGWTIDGSACGQVVTAKALMLAGIGWYPVPLDPG